MTTLKNPYSDSQNEELIDRYLKLIVKYQQIAPELTKKLDEFGRLRNELQFITTELATRKLDLEKIEKDAGLETNI